MQNSTEINHAINMMFKTADLVLNVPKTMTDVLKAVSDDRVTPNSIMKAMNTTLNQAIDKGEADVLFVNPDSNKLKEIQSKLLKNDVYCQTGIYKGQGIIVTFTNQREMAQHVLNKHFAETNFKLVSAGALNSAANGNVASFIVNSEEKAMMIQKRCEQNGIHTNIVHEDKAFIVRYAEDDKDIMDQIKQDVAIDFSGESGKLLARQLEWEKNNACAVINATINDDYEKGSFIADKTGSYIKINRYDVEVFHKGEPGISIRKSDKEFADKVNSEICKMNGPIHLSEEQFQRIKDSTGREREDQLLDIEREQGRPMLSQQDYFLLAKKEQDRELINQKLNQDHPNEVRRDLNDYNANQPIICFKEAERENYEVTHDISEIEQDDAIILDDARAANEGMMDIDTEFSLVSELEIEEQLERSLDLLDKNTDDITHSIDTVEIEAELN